MDLSMDSNADTQLKSTDPDTSTTDHKMIQDNDKVATSTSISKEESEVKLQDEIEGQMRQNEGDGCVICLGNIITSSTRAVASPCLHACFDFSCLATWLELQNTCPLCKQVITYVKYDFDPNGTRFKKESRKNQSDIPRRNIVHHNARRREHLIHGLTCPNDAVLRRRFIYKHQLRSLHCGTNRLSRFSNFTPNMVRDEAELQSKAKAWIRRELNVFEWTKENREWLLEYLLAVVKSMNLKAADGSAEKLVGEFIGKEFAGIFVHELHAYLRSPFTRIEDFDTWSQYEISVPRYVDGKEVSSQTPSSPRPLVVREPSDNYGSALPKARADRFNRNLSRARWHPYPGSSV